MGRVVHLLARCLRGALCVKSFADCRIRRILVAAIFMGVFDDTINKLPPIDRNRELLKTARAEVYKTAGGAALHAYIWEPEPEKTPPHPKSAIAFFFSSGWDNGQVSQFAPHCVYLASRGMAAMAFEYRVSAKNRTTPVEAMSDARSAIRWLRLNAAELGINPAKIVGAGGSGGAHIVAAAAMLDGFDEPGEDASISCAPNALVLFNPILDTSSKRGFGVDRFPTPELARHASLMGAIRKGLPPMVIFHGTADRVVPVDISETFEKKMRRKRNAIMLMPFEGQGHGFFNLNVSFDFYQSTLSAIDEFLVVEGFIEPDPDATLEAPM
jgi:acetyl esterase/lipase